MEILKNMNEYVFFHLRISKEMDMMMKELLDKRRGISKSGWIIEAIHEKILREGK